MAALVLVSTVGLSREEWLAYRNKGIGGSDAATVCGINKYESPFELWMKKTGQLPPEEAGEAAYWGTRLESLIRDEFTIRTGMKVIPVTQILRSRDYSFMLANLDGVCRCPVHGKCVFEAKTANAYKSGEWEGDKVPPGYYLQVQHYLCVTGYNGAYIAALIGGNSFQWKFIKRDEETISMIIRKERDFWTHVQNNVPPPLDGSDTCAEFLYEQYPECIPLSKIKLPDSAADLIRSHGEASAQIDIFNEQKQHAANLLKQMLGDNEIGTTIGGYIKWQTVMQNRIDSKLLKAEQPDIYEKYTAKSSHRKFTVKTTVQSESNTQNESLREVALCGKYANMR